MLDFEAIGDQENKNQYPPLKDYPFRHLFATFMLPRRIPFTPNENHTTIKRKVENPCSH